MIGRLQGHIHQYLGDGILGYFSYPHAHEDDPERAVRAGLVIVSELDRINPQLESERGVQLRVRIGIHTGDVVMGETGSGKDRGLVAWGHTVNLADRLQKVTTPGTVVISGETARLVRGLFVTNDLGAQSLQGIADPVPAYRVVRESRARSRLDVAVATGLTPLVGREKELHKLLDCWDRASEGRGYVALVRGEPGIGKSRLVYAMRDRLAGGPHTWLECRGSPYHEHTAFFPVIGLLRQEFGLTSGQPEPRHAARMKLGLDRQNPALSELAPLFTSLLSLPLPEGCEPLALSPEEQRRKTLDALVEWVLALARMQPTVLAIEDLHWIDSSSRELLGMLIEQVGTAPLLLLATFRPSFEPLWPAGPRLIRTTIEPLSDHETREMVGRINGAGSLPASLRNRVAEKTDGVPLYVEELTKSLLKSFPIEPGDHRDSPSDLAIPPEL